MSKIFVIFALIGAIFWYYENGGYEAFITAMVLLGDLSKSVTFKKISSLVDAFSTTIFFVLFSIFFGYLFYPNFDDLFLKGNNVEKILVWTTLIFIIVKLLLLILRCLLSEISLVEFIFSLSYNLTIAAALPFLYFGSLSIIAPTIKGRTIDFDYNTILINFVVIFSIGFILWIIGTAVSKRK